MKKKRLISIIASLLVLSILTGCANSGGSNEFENTEPTSSKSSQEHDTLTVVIPSDVGSLYQWDTDDSWALNVICEIVDPLWRISPVDGSVSGCLAEEWEISPDYKECKVKLQEGVKFSNGDPLTTKDVKWTLEEAINQPWCSRWVANFEGVEIVDEYNCILKWSEGDPNFMKYFAQNSMNILPADYIAEVGVDGYKQKPIGTGPFILESWTRGDRIVLKTNKDYFMGSASYDTLVIRMINDANSALMALEAGEVDVVCDLKPTFKDVVAQNENLRWEEAASAVFVYIQVQNQKAPFDDVRVRKALNMAINREQLQAVALGGGGSLAPYGISPYSPQWSDNDLLPAYDPEAARKLLAEAGFPNGLDVTLTCREGDYQKPASEVVQANWADIGVNCKVEVMERNAQINDMIAGSYQLGWQQTTDVILDGSIWGMANDSHYWGGNGANRAFYKNERFDELNALQKIELDPGKRKEYFEEMKQIYWDDCPNMPGFFAPTTCVVNKDLKGTYAAMLNFYRYEWFSW
ncbi:ABC transporter substrate-binding protein [Paratissierella segnis]|uniref:ABC transporter substrate-binding protein n=1 Tax=Paratissierella segnis TaxID=2763679 RepID=A0A926IG75_9FIRM|nr:ABC transporter substrate-binding protein [Paratissierella segnis]MBC8589287.1 ABC transporter substrate-binding protein [Paratissierella segnis]